MNIRRGSRASGAVLAALPLGTTGPAGAEQGPGQGKPLVIADQGCFFRAAPRYRPGS